MTCRGDKGRCSRAVLARGLCSAHYQRWSAGKDIDVPVGLREGDLRFWSKVEKTETCWLWTASTDKNGYGVFTVARPDGTRQHRKAHRVSFEMEYGADALPARDGGKILRHLCGTHACVRPDHLAIGTHRENAEDARLAGTRGKLSPADRKKIRKMIKAGWVQRDIAAWFGVAPSIITRIKQDPDY